MKTQIFTLVVCMVFLTFTGSFATSITVSGDVSGAWQADSVLVTAEITIPDGQTLTINPGTFIEFQGHYKFNVQGRLLAVGTESDMIHFTIHDTTGFSDHTVTAGGWHGIRFINTPATNDSSLIEYCVVEYGKAIGVGTEKLGGGICVSDFDKVRISHNLIQHNMAVGDTAGGGGIVVAYGADVIISQNTITHNQVIDLGPSGNGAVGGGGISIAYTSHPLIVGNTITFNRITDSGSTWGVDGTFGAGIGIYFSCSPHIKGNVISHNSSFGPESGSGGIGIWDHCQPVIENNTISHNSSFHYGGGIGIFEYSNATIADNIIENNYCGSGGGLFIWGYSHPRVVNNLITNNNTEGNGGGVHISVYASPIFVNNLISDNSTVKGGGVTIYSGAPKFINNTIVNNSAEIGGGMNWETTSDPPLLNNIIWGNTATTYGDQISLNNAGSDPNFYYNDIQGGAAAFGGPGSGANFIGDYENNRDLDPLFLGGNEHPYSLQPDSPCIDAGQPDTTGLNLPEFDLAGNPRLMFGMIDMGAYENQTEPTVLEVAGDVSGVWDADIVHVTAEITIPDGQTLTINPGTFIEFQGHYKFNVQGRLLAVGTESDMIHFTIHDTTGFSAPAPIGGWHGIRFINTPATNDSSLIEYCVVEYGKAMGEGDDRNGGGIAIINTDKVRVSHCLIQHNMSYCLELIQGNGGGGAGIAISDYADPMISFNEIVNNLVTGTEISGGGIATFRNSNPKIYGNIISYNTVLDIGVNQGTGGGITIAFDSHPLISHNTITHNLVRDYGNDVWVDGASGGGIIIAFDCNPVIEYNDISDNVLVNSWSTGGGILLWDNCFPVVRNNTISNNTCRWHGGGISFIMDDVVDPCGGYFANNIISGNSVTAADDFGGGGIELHGNHSPIFINNLIMENDASDGGGIRIGSSSMTLINNTIVNNTAVYGGGVFFTDQANPSIINNVIWDNTASSFGNQVYLYSNGADPNFYYNDIQGGTEAFGGNGSGAAFTGDYENNLDLDPLFLGGNEHPYSLQPDSPCIDAGTLDLPDGVNLPIDDILGNFRIWDGDGDEMAIADMGAYEFNSIPVAVEDDEIDIVPIQAMLYQNYPNPFNPTTTIQFSIPPAGATLASPDGRTQQAASLRVYNITGQLVKTLIDDHIEPGTHTVTWDGANDRGDPVGSGVYFYRLQAGDVSQSKRMILLK